MSDEPIFGNDDLVQSLRTSLQNREHSIKAFPGLLRRTIETGAWQSFKTPLGDPVTHKRFHTFLMAEPYDGLGITDEYARQIVKHDKETLDALDEALQNPNALHNVQSKAPTGNSESAALRRLRKDRPDLHSKVLGGELTAHAAMIEAGFRPRTFTVRTDDPESIAATLRRQLDPDVLQKVAELLH